MRAMALPRWGAMCCAAGMLVLGAATAGRADPGPISLPEWRSAERGPSDQHLLGLPVSDSDRRCGFARDDRDAERRQRRKLTPGAETGNPAAALANAGMGCNPGPVGSASVPHGATSKAVCVCKGKNGLPDPGVRWLLESIPDRRDRPHPRMSLSLGGMILPSVDPLNIGTKGRGEGENQDATFLHYHTYSFPLLRMLDLFFNEQCSGGMLSDFDILFLSEIDPTWTYDALAFFTAPSWPRRLCRLPNWPALPTLSPRRPRCRSTNCFGARGPGGRSTRCRAGATAGGPRWRIPVFWRPVRLRSSIAAAWRLGRWGMMRCAAGCSTR